jgi:hypothetical protein
MPETELPWVFTERLEEAGIAYMIVGAFATLAFGAARTTDDIDLVLALDVDAVTAFERAFPETQFYRPPRGPLLEEIARLERGHFNLLYLPTMDRADCYLVGRADALQLWALRNRRRVELRGRGCWVAPPEAVIVKKLEFLREGGSQKHIRDIRSILQLIEVDRAFVGEHVERLGLREHWAVCQPRKE